MMKVLKILNLFIISEKLVIKNINIKYNISNYIYNNYNQTILDLVLISNYLTKAYIKFYMLTKTHTQILFINTTQNYCLLLQNAININNNPYINTKWIPGLLSNWKNFIKIIILYNWLLLVIVSIKNLKLKLNIKSYIKLSKTILKLHSVCKGIKYLKIIPSYIFILDLNTYNIPFKESLLLKKSIILISKNFNILKYSTIPILGDVSKTSINIILSIFNTAYIQSILK